MVEEIPRDLNLEVKLFDEVVANTENSKNLSKTLTHVFENSLGFEPNQSSCVCLESRMRK